MAVSPPKRRRSRPMSTRRDSFQPNLSFHNRRRRNGLRVNNNNVATNEGAVAPSFGRLVNVTKTFKTADQSVEAVKDVSFDFRKGSLVSLLGPSGCGKTTVLKMVGGLVSSSGGLIELDSRTISEPFPGVGVAFQAPTLMPWRTVLSNILFPMEVLRRNDAAAKTRALDIIKLVGLD